MFVMPLATESESSEVLRNSPTEKAALGDAIASHSLQPALGGDRNPPLGVRGPAAKKRMGRLVI